jgi:RNA polymerase sigma-70 factor, ECF subfamily
VADCEAPISAQIERTIVETDEALLRAYVGGQTRAFATLVARYQRELYHFLARFLGDRAVAEDIFQEAFLQVHESAPTFDVERKFRPWLFTIAANKARDYLRSKNRHPTSPLDAPINGDVDGNHHYVDLLEAASELPEGPLAREELRAAVQHIIDDMPHHLREVLLLGHFHEFSYKQIAEMLHLPLGTVKSRLHAAVGHFSKSWTKQAQMRNR